MAKIEYNSPESQGLEVVDDTEAGLRAEIESLKRKLDEQQRLHQPGSPEAHAAAAPKRRTLWLMALVLVILIVAGFVTGYIPHRRREGVLIAEANAEEHALPTVTVVGVERSLGSSTLVLPGNIQAVTEAPVLARANGYIKRRYADIGDRVKAGQLLAEIEAPELDQQVQQAQAAVEQVGSALEQATANLQQGNEQLAKVTAQRWEKLVAKGAVSRQDNDTYQAQYAAQQANVQALEKAVSAARSNILAAKANVSRLTDLQGYKSVYAPFAGVITLRNVDVGALVSEASTLLFRVAQTNRLRTYANVPQSESAGVHVGQVARLVVPDLGGRQFIGTVTRTANALDPTTRTLLTEVQVANADGALMPGMYTLVDMTTPRKNPPLLIPGDTLVVRGNGSQAAVVGADHTVHFQQLQLGRDFGDKIEVLSGLEAGQQVVVNPGDTVQEGAKVNPVPLREKKRPA
jgi:RND family efflux transporter MFP subunit